MLCFSSRKHTAAGNKLLLQTATTKIPKLTVAAVTDSNSNLTDTSQLSQLLAELTSRTTLLRLQNFVLSLVVNCFDRFNFCSNTICS
jgi:hypothetical protein